MDFKDNTIINCLSYFIIYIKIKINCIFDILFIYLIINIGYEIMVNDNNNYFWYYKCIFENICNLKIL